MIFSNLLLTNSFTNRAGGKEVKTPPKNYMTYYSMKLVFAANPNTQPASKGNSIKKVHLAKHPHSEILLNSRGGSERKITRHFALKMNRAVCENVII
jgi:hypothetical protein